jgi:type VI secretion system protein ImpF
MAAPRPAPLAPALLFDRLADDDPATRYGQEKTPLRALDGRALRDSLARELTDLLNTRAPFTAAELEGRARTTLEYGLPDVSSALPGSAAWRSEVAERMRAAIAAYEPRLRQPTVTVEPVEGRPAALWAHVRGTLEAGAAPVPVEFTLCAGCPGGSAP